ncbi:hypothetical protein PGT21_030418 [Puccinia graminis f. sp. tritici]|uniref:Uncharacterized protein n=1 Tax=Puccinia graminis f. sp. tritici TaxID=56615 RepID=A0A5B0MQL9_PUCGR|nr:hypothetical protein PGT21_030418 [Puccinia graminis f. sp. tritici]
MLSFFKRRSLDMKRESGTYHELNEVRKISMQAEVQALTLDQPIVQINHFDFDIIPLPNSLIGEPSNVQNSLSKISRRKTVQIPLKPAKKFGFARPPSPKKCESVIRQLKTILANSNPQQQQASIKPAIEPSVGVGNPRKKKVVSKTDSRKILGHLNDPAYATTIISMLKEEPHPVSVLDHPGQNPARLPRGVCLRESQSEFDCPSAVGAEAMEVSKTLTVRVPGPSDVINLVTGLAAGKILGSLAQSAGFYDALAIGSKYLVENTEGHQELVGMVPKDRVSVWCYWWGFEIALPLESVDRLKTVKSIEAATVQLLLALTVAGGAVELVPFIRFISGYLDMEWAAISEQNKGKGVVVAATWALPMALVPRPWDFGSPATVAPLGIKAPIPPPAANVLAISSQ